MWHRIPGYIFLVCFSSGFKKANGIPMQTIKMDAAIIAFIILKGTGGVFDNGSTILFITAQINIP